MTDTPSAREMAERIVKRHLFYNPQTDSIVADIEQAMLAYAAEVEGVSEGRRKVLEEKSEQLRVEWIRAERAEAHAAELERKLAASDDVIAYLELNGLHAQKHIAWTLERMQARDEAIARHATRQKESTRDAALSAKQ